MEVDLREGPGGGLGDVGGVHVARHVGLLFEFGLQQRVLHDADPHVHLNNLLLQLGQTLLDLHHRS